MTSGTISYGKTLAIVATLALLAGALGCKKDDAASAKGGDKGARAARAEKKPVMKDGLSEDWRLDHPECLQARKIESPEPGTPEAVLRGVFAAASGPDTEAGFQAFYAALDPEKYKEQWARDQFWQRSREHVSKYVEGASDPTYIVCREDRRSDTETKLFVFSKDPKKSHTPYGFTKSADGTWRITFFTP